MSESYRARIEAFCRQADIVIPAGFYRHPPCRYATVDIGQTPNKLIPRTWRLQEDVAYYLTHLGEARPMKVLEFKERVELSFNGNKSFSRIGQW
ncbi:hypothetical protein [Pseudomonas sp. CGJS7]|uniref:hypothetical protein n=1 Tax=Pseudomonas sp. CGJS7 TaxID=3109348 RepID=UPI003009D2EB